MKSNRVQANTVQAIIVGEASDWYTFVSIRDGLTLWIRVLMFAGVGSLEGFSVYLIVLCVIRLYGDTVQSCDICLLLKS
jgi:hypothetical protein